VQKITAFIVTGLFSCLFSQVAFADYCVTDSDNKDRQVCFGEITGCAGIDGRLERLACYDRLFSVWRESAAGMSSSVTKAPSVPSATKEVVATTAVAEKDKGLNRKAVDDIDKFGKKKAADAPIEYIEALITKVEQNPYGIDHLRLDNGQVWKETMDSKYRFKKGQRVRIESAILNTFNLRIEGLRKTIKVRRIN